MKKIISLFMVVCMVLGLSVCAYADDEEIVNVTLSPMPSGVDLEEKMIDFLSTLGIESYVMNEDFSASFSMEKEELMIVMRIKGITY